VCVQLKSRMFESRDLYYLSSESILNSDSVFVKSFTSSIVQGASWQIGKQPNDSFLCSISSTFSSGRERLHEPHR